MSPASSDWTVFIAPPNELVVERFIRDCLAPNGFQLSREPILLSISRIDGVEYSPEDVRIVRDWIAGYNAKYECEAIRFSSVSAPLVSSKMFTWERK